MVTFTLFNAAVLWPVACAHLVAQVAWITGYCSSWLARNVRRFCTVMWGVSSLLAWHERHDLVGTIDMIIVVFGAFNWNRPSDDQGPPRRRKRKKPVEKKETRLDWTGTSVPT